MTRTAAGPAPKERRALRPGSHRLARVSEASLAPVAGPLAPGLLNFLVATLVAGSLWSLLLLLPGKIEGPLLLGFVLAPVLGGLAVLSLRAAQAELMN